MHSRITVITGASGGIGAAVALRLAEEGDRLVLAARRVDALEQVAAEARTRGAADVRVVATDVTRRADVERLRDAALSAFGGVDVWINNAGRGITRSVLDLTDDDVDDMMLINVKSALYGMQAIVPHFVERGAGHVVNVSSMLGRVPLAPFRSAYSAAKAALNSLTTNLRMDLAAAHPGVHVSLVLPGVVTTDFSRNVRGEPLPSIANPAAAAQTPEEVADVVAALLRAPADEVYTHPRGAALVRDHYARNVPNDAAGGAPA